MSGSRREGTYSGGISDTTLQDARDRPSQPASSSHVKLALSLTRDAATARLAAEAMIEAQRHDADCATRVIPFALGCLALVGRPGEPTDCWPVWTGTDGSFLAFAGLPLCPGGAGPGPVRAAHPVVRSAVGDGDRAAAPHLLRDLDGAFVALWWNAPAGNLTVVTDFLGMQPVYSADAAGAFVLASEVKAFARAGLLPAEPDAGAWGAMLLFGHQIGPRSLLAGATRLPSATSITYGPEGVMESGTTWRWPASGGRSDSPALRDALGDAIRADVAAYAAAHPDAALLLSGGFDSRLILCLVRDLGLAPRLLARSHPDENADADLRFARAFARSAGMPVRVFPARADFFSTDDYLEFLELNEVATPSLDLFIPNVAPMVRGERGGVWEGLLLDPALKFDHGEGGFANYLGGRAKVRAAYAAALERVFAPVWARRVRAEFDGLVAAEQAGYTDDAEGVWRFSVLNRSRFRTGINPYQVYDTFTIPLTPGMSRHFWEVAAEADPPARFGKRLYRAVFDRLAPEGMRVPVATGSTLIPGSGGRLLYYSQRGRAAVQRFAQRPRVTRKLRSAGLPTPFTWEPSRFLDVALAEAGLDDTRLNAHWLASQREGSGPADPIGREILLYWQAWHHLMRGGLAARWGGVAAR